MLLILTKIKFLTNTDLKQITYRWAICWTVANFSGIIGAIVELVGIAKQEAKLIAQKRVLAHDSSSKENQGNQKLS